MDIDEVQGAAPPANMIPEPNLLPASLEGHAEIPPASADAAIGSNVNSSPTWDCAVA